MNKVLNVKYKILKYALWSAGVILCVLFFVLLPSIKKDFGFSKQTKASAPWPAGREGQGGQDYWQTALVLEQKGDLAQAIWNFRQFLEQKPGDVEATKHLIKLYLQTSQLNQALDYAQRLTQANPKSPEGFFYLGMTYNILGQIDTAKENYKKVINIDPKYADAYFNLGFLSESSGQLLEAIDFYKKTLEINSKHAKAYYNLGNAYADLDKNQEAIGSYKSAVAYDPNYTDAFVNLSILLTKVGEYKEAIKYLDEARILGYEAPEEYLRSLEPYREDIYIKRGKMDEGRWT